MTTTGIYGGSFNPIHRGHTQLAEQLCREGRVDELWFLISPQNPLKRQADLLPDRVRLELARQAVQESRQMRVSDFEFRLPRPSFMADTLAALRQTYPERRFVLVIGADNWLSFDRWHRPEEIRRNHLIIVYPRPGYPLAAGDLPEGVTLADTPLLDISSTELREAIRRGTYRGDDRLHPAVWKEIQEKGYYREAEEGPNA